jgi:hypothetical protein
VVELARADRFAHLTSDDSGTMVSLRPRTKMRSMSSGVVRRSLAVCTITSYCSASRL